MRPFSKSVLSRSLLATFLATGASGAYADYVLQVPLSAVAAASPSIPTAPAEVPAAATEIISVSPGGWHAGNVAAGASVTHTFTVTNISGAPIEELGVWRGDGSTTGFVVVPEQTTCVTYPDPQDESTFNFGSLPTGGSCQVAIRFTSNGSVQQDFVLFDAANTAGAFTGMVEIPLSGNASNLGGLTMEPIGTVLTATGDWYVGIDPTDGASNGGPVGDGCMYNDSGRFWFGSAEASGFGLCAGVVLTNSGDTAVTGISLSVGFQMQQPVALAPPATFIQRTTTEDSALYMGGSSLTPLPASNWDCPASGTFDLGPGESCMVLHVVKPGYEANGVGAISDYTVTATGGVQATYRWRGFVYNP